MQTRPSRLYLPKFDRSPKTIFEYMLARFPQISAAIWRERIARGLITLSDGTRVDEQRPYKHGITVFYRREVQSEPPASEEPVIIYRDEEILVVDKPHGMPVTPSGEHVERCLLVTLQRLTSLPDLDPVHRLDRETAGLVLFTIKTERRAQYHRLFAEGRVDREYMAIAHVAVPPVQRRWVIRNRLEQGEPWFRQRIAEGPVNAITEVELEVLERAFGQFRLIPRTGKKHQLRVHMASIGCPILGDPFYPTIQEKRHGDVPLQLLARSLGFVDPLTSESRRFVSTRTLQREFGP